MKVLLVHISDIHLRDQAKNPSVGHVGLILKAVRNLEYGLGRCVVVISGDVAYGGHDEEYLAAVEFVGALQQGLHEQLQGGPPVSIVGVPGNHDCVLIPEPKARTYTIDGLLRQERPEIDENVVEECTAVQDNFFRFLDAVDEGRRGDRLVYEYEFITKDESLTFRCFNTSWLSRIPEKPGDLYFPVSLMPVGASTSGVIISVFHHPYHWLRQGNYREFRKSVEEVSDLVLTGHEHHSDLRRLVGDQGQSLYLEGAALQPHAEEEASGFNTVVIDTQLRTQSVDRFEWDGERYVTVSNGRQSEPFQIPLRRAGLFDLLEETEKWLDDLELTVQHPLAGTLKLADLFVPIDMEVGANRVTGPPRRVRGEALFEEMRNAKRLLITGPEKIGKTAVAKMLYRAALSDGMVPLFIDARSTRLRLKRLNDDLAELCAAQYGTKAVEAYLQLDRARRLLIVDEAHRLHLTGQSVAELLEGLCQASDHVVLFANDVVQSLAEATQGGPNGTGTSRFEDLRLQELGHERRQQLAERWFVLDPSVIDDPHDLARKLVEVKRMIDTTVGFSFVPAYPVFLIPILQAQDSNQSIDLSASTYGYFYELLIKSSLLKGAPARDMDVRLAYLTYVAAAMFRQGVEEISEAEFLSIHQAFQAERLVELRFTQTVTDLARRGVLYDADGRFGFRYRYIRYYFTARHMAETIGSEQTQADLARLTENLHKEENANLLLFLAHLSRDRSILDGMLGQAARIFAGVPEAELRGSLSGGSEANQLATLAVDDRPVQERQRALMQELDREGDAQGDSSAGVEAADTLQTQLDAVNEVVTRFAIAYRTLQILGQTVKNFPGSMKGEEKLRVVGEVFSLGLRTLGALLELIRATEGEVRELVADSIRKADPLAPRREVLLEAQRTIHGMAHMGSYGLIRRIALAVGSRDLGPVYDRLVEAKPSPAMETIRMALRLEQFSESLPRKEIERLATAFREDEPRAYELLRHLVYHYLQIFDVGYVDKQSICSQLEISYPKLLTVNPDRKLLHSKNKPKHE
jgi:hypothetical protein